MTKIHVGFNTATQEITVQPMQMRTNRNHTDIEWEPKDGVDISFVGFAAPVGTDCAISIPKKASGKWAATDTNDLQPGQKPVHFKYTVWVELDGVAYSRDPEIVNDPPSGA